MVQLRPIQFRYFVLYVWIPTYRFRYYSMAMQYQAYKLTKSSVNFFSISLLF